TGTVAFNLYPPGDPTCAGAPFQSQTVDLSNPANCTINGTSFQTNCSTSNTFTVNAAGTWRWTAVYSGNTFNPSLTSGCGAENVTVNAANPTIQTSPNPTSGAMGTTSLGDSAELQGGYFPTGT